MNEAPPPLPWNVRTRPEQLVLVFAAASALSGIPLLIAHHFGVAAHACIWKRVTGLPCAGCGGTRAADALLHGDPAAAFVMNPAASAGILLLALLTAYACGILIFRMEPLRPTLLRGRGWRTAVLATLVANWIYLLLAGRA